MLILAQCCGTLVIKRKKQEFDWIMWPSSALFGLVTLPPNPVPIVPVVAKNCCQAFIFNYRTFASGPKTLEKML